MSFIVKNILRRMAEWGMSRVMEQCRQPHDLAGLLQRLLRKPRNLLELRLHRFTLLRGEAIEHSRSHFHYPEGMFKARVICTRVSVFREAELTNEPEPLEVFRIDYLSFVPRVPDEPVYWAPNTICRLVIST